MTGGAEPQGAAATGTGTAASTNNSPYEASWEPELAQQIADMVKVKEDASNISSSSSCRKYPYCMVGLCGIPGSGKSVSSLLLANALETLGLECMIMPHDGYHYPLETLQTFPHAEDAIYRRGAPDTFDAQALLRDLQRIRPLIQEEEQQPQQQEDKKDNNVDLGNPQEQQDKDDEKDDNMEQWIRLPGFDHGKGDPEPGVHIFDRQKHQVVICEGLYLFHDRDGWRNVQSYFDIKIYMESDWKNAFVDSRFAILSFLVIRHKKLNVDVM